MYSITSFVFLITLGKVISEPVSNFTKPDVLPKFIAIDVDGTFYTTNSTALEKNIKALKLLKSKNVKPFFCTGRSYQSIKELFGANFETDSGYNFHPGVYSNGSLAYGTDGILVHKSVFTKDIVKKFLKFVVDKNYEKNCVFFGISEIFTLDANLDPKDELTLKLDPVVKPKEEIENEEITGIRIKKVNIEGGLTAGVDYIKFDEKNIQVLFPEPSSKDQIIPKLLAKMDGVVSECAYIGNDLNDLKSMALPNMLSFAVGDSKDEVKEQAKWVLSKRHDEGAFEEMVNLLYGE